MIKYSIIIPTLNQAANLKKCLYYLSKLHFDQEFFEVLVIDNGSTDNTMFVTLPFRNELRNLNYYYCQNPGLMAARHMGCEKAKGKILCYIDDDSLVTEDWLSGIDDSFSDENILLVGGPCLPKYEVKPPKWVELFCNRTEYGMANYKLSLINCGDKEILIPPNYVYGCNYSVRKDIFIELGGTCPDYYPKKYWQFIGTGENSLTYKLFAMGHMGLYNPRVKISHFIPHNRMTIEYFYWKRYYNGIGASFIQTRKEHGLFPEVPKPIKTNKETDLSVKTSPINVSKRFAKTKGFIKKQLLKTRFLNSHKEYLQYIEIKEQIEQGYKEGFAFHQQEMKKNPKLLEWVLRENYWGENGKLPVD